MALSSMFLTQGGPRVQAAGVTARVQGVVACQDIHRSANWSQGLTRPFHGQCRRDFVLELGDDLRHFVPLTVNFSYADLTGVSIALDIPNMPAREEAAEVVVGGGEDGVDGVPAGRPQRACRAEALRWAFLSGDAATW